MKQMGSKINLLATLVLMSVCTCSQSGGIKIDVRSDGDGHMPGYHHVWDSVQDRLILYRNADVSTLPAARPFRDGNSVALYPLKDFPEAQSMTIWSAAATNEDGVILSTTLRYSPRGVKPAVLKAFLLTYDASGNLKKVWDIYPCQPDHIAVDHAGNVFAVGARDSRTTNYSLIVKYSSKGEVLREFLPANYFPEGDLVIESNPIAGESDMFINNEQLILWVAQEQQLLRFSLSGDLLGKVSLKETIKGFADRGGVGRIEVRHIAIAGKSSEGIIAQVVLWPKDDQQRPSFGMLKFSSDGSQLSLMEPLSTVPGSGYFIGTSQSGKMVFLENIPSDGTAMLKEY